MNKTTKEEKTAYLLGSMRGLIGLMLERMRLRDEQSYIEFSMTVQHYDRMLTELYINDYDVALDSNVGFKGDFNE